MQLLIFAISRDRKNSQTAHAAEHFQQHSETLAAVLQQQVQVCPQINVYPTRIHRKG